MELQQLDVMKEEIITSLCDINYQGPLQEDSSLVEAVSGNLSIDYTKLIEWLTLELKVYANLEDHVRHVSGPEDVDTFEMEMSGFLREYGCPYAALTSGLINERFSSVQNRLLLLQYLVTEFQAARMFFVQDQALCLQSLGHALTQESPTAAMMRQILVALGFGKPPQNLTSFILFSKVESKVKELLSDIPTDHLRRPLLKMNLSEKQWKTIEKMNHEMIKEYECRREMLLKRLDVTLRSFECSERLKNKKDALAAFKSVICDTKLIKSKVDIGAILAAREDLLDVVKTSSGDARDKTKCDINRVKIGRVPDRGGRAYELEPPPPEMPSFQQRSHQQQGDRQGSGRGDHRGRGGRDDRRGGRDDRRGGDRRGGRDDYREQRYSAPPPQSQLNPNAAAFFGSAGGMNAGYNVQYQQAPQQQQYYSVGPSYDYQEPRADRGQRRGRGRGRGGRQY